MVDVVDNDMRTARDLAEESGQGRAINALDNEELGCYIFEGRIVLL